MGDSRPGPAGAGVAGRLGAGEKACLASAPGLLVSTAGRDLLAQEPVPPGSRDAQLEVRVSGGRSGWAWGRGGTGWGSA